MCVSYFDREHASSELLTIGARFVILRVLNHYFFVRKYSDVTVYRAARLGSVCVVSKL